MIYVRGNRKDYDQWSQMGNAGWGYDDLQKYFTKIDDLDPEIQENHSKYGKGGNVAISKFDTGHPVEDFIKKAGEELGVRSFENEAPIGYFKAFNTIQNGVRNSASKAYLSKIGKRDNLYLGLNAHVLKVLIEPESKIALGVEVKIGEKILKLFAQKETVLSAGTINSPQLLMLSGNFNFKLFCFMTKLHANKLKKRSKVKCNSYRISCVFE